MNKIDLNGQVAIVTGGASGFGLGSAKRFIESGAKVSLWDRDPETLKQAVELLFEVKVDNVQVANVRGKVKRFGRTPGKRQNWKKAYVKLKEGSDIDFVGAES